MAITYEGSLGNSIWANSTDGSFTDVLTIAIATDVDEDNFILVGFSHDNFLDDESGTANHHVVISGLGIKWERIQEVTASIAGVLASGVITSLWLGRPTGAVAAGQLITATLDQVTAHITMGASLFSVSPGNAVRIDKQIASNPVTFGQDDQVQGYPPQTISGAVVPKQRLFFRSLSREQSTTNATSPASGFTIAWDLRSAPNTDSSVANIKGIAEFILSTDSSETSNPTGSGNFARMASIMVAFDEYTPIDRNPDAIPPSVPEDEVTEVWNWRTAITTSWDSTEQRIRLMPGPIRAADFKYILVEEEDVVEWQDKLHASVLNSMAVPYYQYMATIKFDAIAGEDAVQFDTEAAQIKAGDDVMLLNILDRSIKPMFRTMYAVDPDYGGIVTPDLDHSIDNGWIICPVYDSYVRLPQYNMKTVTGDFTLSAEVIDRTRALSRDGVTDLREYFDGLLIVRRKTLAEVTHRYEAELEDFASSFGARLRVSSWSHPRLERAVRFFVPNKGASVELDRWMQYFDELAGAHRPFYISSGLRDLDLFEPYSNGDNFIKVVGSRYSDDYEDDPVYQQFSILFSDNVVREYVMVSSSTQIDGNDLITLNTDLPDDLTIIKISYLYRVRLATDQVTVKHLNNKIYFSFAIKGTEN